MTFRYCPTCNGEVEDTGGFCFLGHPLTLRAPTASLTELRAEVDAAFDEARAEVARAMAYAGPSLSQRPPATAETSGRAPAAAPPPPPSPSASSRTLEPDAESSRSERSERPPQPPPASSQPDRLGDGPRRAGNRAAGDAPHASSPNLPDPIAAFAPPARMDWGPQRSFKGKRSLRRLRPARES